MSRTSARTLNICSVWSDRQRQAVIELVESGIPDREIARRTGVPRATVGTWRRQPRRARRFRVGDPGWRPSEPALYCYLLGLYLGDGHIVRQGRSARICITLDYLYRDVVAEADRALTAVFPESKVVCRKRRSSRTIDLQLSDSSIPYAFPQCGPGKKHEREIRLEGWQEDLTRTSPKALIRGLIHSDGCRSMDRFSTRLPSGRLVTYEYPRYFFSNLSADIRGIFCAHCDLLGLRWTLSNRRNVSIAHRDSVALLDEFVGPKS
jgi:Homeodomain-like domain